MKREEFRKRLLMALFDSKEQLLLDNWMKQTPFYQIDLNRATEKEYQNEPACITSKTYAICIASQESQYHSHVDEWGYYLHAMTHHLFHHYLI